MGHAALPKADNMIPKLDSCASWPFTYANDTSKICRVLQSGVAMAVDEKQLPDRLITRFLCEAQLACAVDVLRGFKGNYCRGATFLLVWRHGLNRIHSPAKNISINAIAASLDLPYETVRRHMHKLVEAGLCLMDRNGARLNPSARTKAFIAERTESRLAAFRQMLADLARFDVAFPEGLLTENLSADAVAATLIDLELCSMEFHRPGTRTAMELCIIVAFLTANIREVTYSDELAECFGRWDTPVPTLLRKPISINRVSAILGVPYATLWRHVQKMIATGHLTEHRDGYIVATEWIARPETIEASRKVISYFRRSLFDLAATAPPTALTNGITA